MLQRVLITCAAVAILASGVASGQPPLVTRDVATGLDTPWEILWGPDDWIWMTERGGRISRVNPTTGLVVPLITLADVFEQSESGLLGMVLHPDFGTTPWVYVVYNYRVGNAIAERLVRYVYDGSTLTDPDTLLTDIPGFPTHDGSRLLVTADRKLLMTTGDAQDQPAAQSHMSISGKVLRMNLDGTPATDNPFPSASYPANLLWSSGHRNAQGLVQAPNGIIYESEHGPNNDDELNIIEASRNYGWPTVHGPCDLITEQQFCTDSNVVEPIADWTPTLAVAGLDYYGHSAISEWQGKLLLVSLKESDLRSLRLSGDGRDVVDESIYFDDRFGRLRDLCISRDGRVFIATSNRDGRARSPFPVSGDDRIVEIRSAIGGAGEDLEPHGSLRVLPSPASDAIMLTAQLDAAGEASVTLVDAIGRVCWRESIVTSDRTLAHRIDVSALSRGAYYIRVVNGGRSTVAPTFVR
jgi:glucose/arabinose dehydrogenase